MNLCLCVQLRGRWGYLDDGGGGERKGRMGDGVGEDEIVGEIGADSALKALQTHFFIIFFFFHFQPVQSRGLNWIWTAQGPCSLVGWLVRSGTPSPFLQPDSRVSLFCRLPDRSTYSHSRAYHVVRATKPPSSSLLNTSIQQYIRAVLVQVCNECEIR